MPDYIFLLLVFSKRADGRCRGLWSNAGLTFSFHLAYFWGWSCSGSTFSYSINAPLCLTKPPLFLCLISLGHPDHLHPLCPEGTQCDWLVVFVYPLAQHGVSLFKVTELLGLQLPRFAEVSTAAPASKPQSSLFILQMSITQMTAWKLGMCFIVNLLRVTWCRPHPIHPPLDTTSASSHFRAQFFIGTLCVARFQSWFSSLSPNNTA